MWISLACRRNSFLEDCVVTTEVRAACEVRITQVEVGGPRGNCTRKEEAWRTKGRHMCCLFCLWVAVRDCTESWIAWELKLCVILRYFHLYDNTDSRVFSWGFPLSILLCFMCDWIFFFVICVMFDLAQNQLSFHKFDCRSRLSIFL